MISSALIQFALKRLQSRAGLSLLMVASIALATAMMLSVSVFAGAISRAMMRQETSARTEWTHRPLFSVRFYAAPSDDHPLDTDDIIYARDWIANMLERHVGLPVALTYVQYESPRVSLAPADWSTRYTSSNLGQTRVACALDIEKHIQVIDGRPYGDPGEAGYLSVWVLASAAADKGFQVGEKYALWVGKDEDEVIVPILVAGLWDALDISEPYWYQSPFGLMGGMLLTTPEQYQAILGHLFPKGTDFAFWYLVLDDRRLDFNRAQQYIAGLKSTELEVIKSLPAGRMDYAPLEELERGQQRKDALAAILFAFSLPLLGILVFFVSSTSSIIARYQHQETAMLTSRGASRIQILGLVLVETLLVLGVACPLGTALSLPLARLLGHAQSFLEFVPRPALEPRLAPADWQYVGVVAAICLVARLLPAWSSAASTVVLSERQIARRRNTSTAARFLAIALLIGLTAYTYRRLSYSGPLALLGWRPDGAAPTDPMLVLAPTLFFFTTPLVAAELFTILIRPLLWLGRLSPSPSIYLAFLGLSREGGQYRVPVFLLVLCLSFGVFYASLARSADNWLLDRVHYQVGADLTFEPGVEPGSGDPSEVWLIPIGEYRKLSGVADATRVAEYAGQISLGKSIQKLRVLGVDRTDLTRIAFYRPDFSVENLGSLMNRLGGSSQSVLLPTRLAAELTLDVGDRVPLQLLMGDSWHSFDLEVAGTFGYFPTMYEGEQPVAVVNLDYLERQMGGVSAHNIWIRLKPGATSEEVMTEVRAFGVLPLTPHDAQGLIGHDRSRSERIGIFGTLSLCYVAGALLAIADLLVYYSASLRGRSIRFAVLQAMGMGRAGPISIVSCEYLVTLLWGIVSGTALGVLGSNLYVPFFALTENPENIIPPFIPVVDWQRAGWMAAIMGVTLILIGGISLWGLVRTRIFEVLRLGVRE